MVCPRKTTSWLCTMGTCIIFESHSRAVLARGHGAAVVAKAKKRKVECAGRGKEVMGNVW